MCLNLLDRKILDAVAAFAGARSGGSAASATCLVSATARQASRQMRADLQKEHQGES